MAVQPRADLATKAICAGVFGNIQWKDSATKIVRDDAALQGLTLKGIRALLRQFVMDGNALTVRQETRTEYLEANPDDPYWYRAILPVAELGKGLFVELKLIDDDEEEPFVEIVSAHRQL